MRKGLTGAAVLVLLAGGGISAQRMLSRTPDAIFYNGTVVTGDTAGAVFEAFAVQGDRFLAIGTNAEIRALAGRETRMVDLKNLTVIPGLIDNHNHQYHVALLTLRGVDLQNVGSLADLLARLRKAAVSAAPGETIFTTTGWSAAEFPERRPPTRQELDEVAPAHPVVVYASRSLVHVNSKALDALGVTPGMHALQKVEIRRDENGEATGVLSGSPANTLNLLARIVPQPTLEEKKALITSMQAQQHAMGLTGVRELQLHPDVMRAYFELWREHKLTMRISMGLELNAGEEDRLEAMIAPWGVASGFGDEWLRLDGIAEYNPGELLREPPMGGDSDDLGELRLKPETFRQAILVMNRYGWRPSIHVSGDGALDLVLDAYEAADRERSIRDRRWVVEHIPIVHPDQMERMKRLGVVVSAQFQPYARARSLVERLGRERAERAVPMRELLDHGLIVSGGSDWPGAPNNPFVNIHYYVTRQTRQMGPLGVAQKISRQEALRVEAYNNAYLTYEEDIKGSIEPGKLADFVVLSADLLTVPEEQILSIRPLATYVGGQKVYSDPKGGF